VAIVVLVLWLFSASAGFYLLVTSNLGRARPAAVTPAAEPTASEPTASEPTLAESATASAAATAASAAPVAASAATAASAASAASVAQAASAAPAAAAPLTPPAAAPAAQTVPATQASATPPPASKREMRRAARNRFDPPSLTAAKNAPVVPGLRSLLEFAHPAFAIVGLGFWLGFTLVHNRALGWIAFGLVTVTVCLGLTWYTANTRAARSKNAPGDEPAPSFSNRLVILHGSAATVTFVLAALTALVLSR
jgi:hypothetical protein